MRWRALGVASLLLLAPLAGCLGADDDQTSPEPRSPDQIHDERSVSASVSPDEPLLAGPCEAETARCFVYTIDVPSATPIEAQLAWGNPVNDLELYLYPYAEDTPLAQATGSPADTTRTLTADLDPGTYRLVVVTHLAVDETYTLDVTYPDP